MADESGSRCRCRTPQHEPKLIVLTGGPGAGKTAVLEIARRHFCSHVAVLPEAAGIVYRGGFVRGTSIPAMKAAQRAIFHIQRELETLVLSERAAAVALCDRGTVDGLAYWPNSEESFWSETGTTRALEFSRYSAVIHLRTPGLHQGYNNDNPIRIESATQAAAIDQKIEAAWRGHPNLHVVTSEIDFVDKAAQAIRLIRAELPECCRQ